MINAALPLRKTSLSKVNAINGTTQTLPMCCSISVTLPMLFGQFFDVFQRKFWDVHMGTRMKIISFLYLIFLGKFIEHSKLSLKLSNTHNFESYSNLIKNYRNVRYYPAIRYYPVLRYIFVLSLYFHIHNRHIFERSS